VSGITSERNVTGISTNAIVSTNANASGALDFIWWAPTGKPGGGRPERGLTPV
jgi:hypothetical protein